MLAPGVLCTTSVPVFETEVGAGALLVEATVLVAVVGVGGWVVVTGGRVGTAAAASPVDVVAGTDVAVLAISEV